MHNGNLSFFARGTHVLDLTPAYDMSPARYQGQQGNLVEVVFEPRPPTVADANVWDSASEAAIELWQRTAKHRLVSPAFRRIAHANAQTVKRWREGGRLLPR